MKLETEIDSYLETIERLAARGVIVVAPTGNGGPHAQPVYPAAYDAVIAVTAVDRHGRIYRRAGRGGHVDLAAPGVGVWTAASVRGARPRTGTSFAVPFVAAAAALWQQAEPSAGPKEILARMAATSWDLGEPGRDPVYGHGLLQAGALCR